MKEKREENRQNITGITLEKYIQTYNQDHALKLKLHINQAGYNVITFVFPPNDYPEPHKPIEIEPMTNLEAFYFVKGFRFLKDRPS